MSCLSSQRIAELQAELIELEGLLIDIKAAYRASLTGGIKNYKFDSGEGAQSITYTSPIELKALIDDTTADINSIRMKLAGTNLMTMNLRRQTGVYPYGSGGTGGRTV